MRTSHCQTRAAGLRCLTPQLVLIFARAKRRNDLEVFLRRGKLALGPMTEIKCWVSDRSRNHLLVCRISVSIYLTKLRYSLGIIKVRNGSGHKLLGLSIGVIL